MSKKKDFLWRYQPPLNSDRAKMLSYIQNEKLHPFQDKIMMIITALNAYYMALALYGEGSHSHETLELIFLDSVKAIAHHLQYVSIAIKVDLCSVTNVLCTVFGGLETRNTQQEKLCILQNLGIKEEWFLAHGEADVLISGHINREGKWSLSSYRNLEPSFEYTTRNQIFDQVFSPEYVWELAHLREELISNISQVVNNSNDSSSDEDNAINKKDVAVMAEQLSITPNNLNFLRDLIIHSFSDELVALEQELEIEIYNNHLHNEQQSAVNTTNITEIMNYFQREAAPKLDENELFHAQIYLTERIMDEYERQDKDEFVFKPFGIVTINVEDSCCSLRDALYGHTIKKNVTTYQ